MLFRENTSMNMERRKNGAFRVTFRVIFFRSIFFFFFFNENTNFARAILQCGSRRTEIATAREIDVLRSSCEIV